MNKKTYQEVCSLMRSETYNWNWFARFHSDGKRHLAEECRQAFLMDGRQIALLTKRASDDEMLHLREVFYNRPGRQEKGGAK
jgi:hypothetical protein